jgi:predicted deacylase
MELGVPVLTVEGSQPGPTLLVISGTHGDEPEGMGAIFQLVTALDPKELRGRFVGVPVLNTLAHEARRRGNPLDDWNYDMNRLFPGSPSGSITERLAYAVCNALLPKADFLLALHSGGNNIFVCERVIVDSMAESHLGLAKAMGPGWEIIARGAGERASIKTLTAYAASKGTPSLTVELGGASGRLPEEYNRQISLLVAGILNVMKRYQMIPGTPENPPEWILVEYQPIRCNNGGYIVFEPSCRLKAHVKKGTPLLKIYDQFGTLNEEIVAPDDVVILSLPVPYIPYGGAQVMTVGRIVERLRP